MICSNCGKIYSPSIINTYALCCIQPLLAQYADIPFSKEELKDRPHTIWRFSQMLPVRDEKNVISLGEGMSAIVPLDNLNARFGFSSLLMKDESKNPTGSFKARGISVAVSKAKELGIEGCIIPTAGNAGAAMAAYCAAAKIKCVVVMPEHTPEVFKKQCRYYDAELILVKGLINDCAKRVEEIKKQRDYFDVSTLKEPYRLEGKKTIGYEIAEQLDWKLPDVIICPTGGGTALIGIWKAFGEMIELGWIKPPLPRMIAVQTENCAPLLASLRDLDWRQHLLPRPSIAYGLAVPYPFGIDLMQKVIKESGGHVIAVSEKEINEGVDEVLLAEDIHISPEGSAGWKSIGHLLNKKVIAPHNNVLVLNTGSDYKQLEESIPVAV